MKQLLQWVQSSLLLLCLTMSLHAQDTAVEEARKLHEQATETYAMGLLGRVRGDRRLDTPRNALSRPGPFAA